MKRIVLALAVSSGMLGASALPAQAAAPYLSGAITKRKVATLTRDLARAGIGTYRLGARRPVARVRRPVSPLRLTIDQVRSAAIGVGSRTGISGAALDRVTGPARVSRQVSLPPGALLAGWALSERTPGAALARRILGKVDWRHYRTIVFPHVVLLLFSSDVATHLPTRVPSRHRASRSGAAALAGATTAAATGPCSQTLKAGEDAINRVFDNLDRLRTDPVAIRRIVRNNFLAKLIDATGTVVLAVTVDPLVRGGREIVLAGYRLPIKAVTAATASAAAVVGAAGEVANFLAPWTPALVAAPNPITKLVDGGVPGAFTLTVRAPLGDRRWPPWMEDCAKVINFPLPRSTPTNASVKWDVSAQDPANLIVTKKAEPELDDRGIARLTFETTPETPDADLEAPSVLGAVTAVAEVHRRDITRLSNLVTRQLTNVLSSAAAKGFEKQVSGIVGPMVDKVTAQVGKLRDRQVPAVLAVRYHPPEERIPRPAPCTLATQGEVAQAADFPVDPGTQFTESGDFLPGWGRGVSCLFMGSKPVPPFTSPSPIALIRVFDLGVHPKPKFAVLRSIPSPRPSGTVAGLGDDNQYVLGNALNAPVLWVRKLNIAVIVEVTRTNLGLDPELALARLALGRMLR